MIDERTTKYFAETRRELLEELKNISLSEDPDWISLIEGFALLEARLRSEIINKEDVLSDFLLHTLAPELLGSPPACGVLQLKGPVSQIQKYSEIVSGEARWRTNGDIRITEAEILSVKLIAELSHFVLIELVKPESELTVYIDTDEMTSQMIITDMMIGNQKIINFATGEEIGVVSFQDNTSLFETVGNPFSELYDYKWLKVKYNFFKIKLHQIQDKVLLAIKVNGFVKYLPENIFKLNCVPVSSLFRTIASPLKIVPEQTEYECITYHQQYRIEEIKLFNIDAKLILGKDYFISNGKLIFPTRFDGKTALITLLCNNKKQITNNQFIVEDMHYVTGQLIKLIPPESTHEATKWDVVNLYNQNRFNEYYRENRLLEFVQQVMNFFNESNNIKNINVVDDVSIVTEGGYFGMVKTSAIKIEIDLNLSSATLALVWGRIFIKLLPFHIRGKVIIHDVDRILAEISEFI